MNSVRLRSPYEIPRGTGSSLGIIGFLCTPIFEPSIPYVRNTVA
jgi:hypothetical protein